MKQHSAGSPISARVVGAVREPPVGPQSGRKIVAHGATCPDVFDRRPLGNRPPPGPSPARGERNHVDPHGREAFRRRGIRQPTDRPLVPHLPCGTPGRASPNPTSPNHATKLRDRWIAQSKALRQAKRRAVRMGLRPAKPHEKLSCYAGRTPKLVNSFAFTAG